MGLWIFEIHIFQLAIIQSFSFHDFYNSICIFSVYYRISWDNGGNFFAKRAFLYTSVHRKMCNKKTRFDIVFFLSGDALSRKPDEKNSSNRTHSSPRGWRLSISWGCNCGTPKIRHTLQHYGIGGLRVALNWAPIYMGNQIRAINCRNSCGCSQINIFEMLLTETEIRLYLPFSDWFRTKQTSVWYGV